METVITLKEIHLSSSRLPLDTTHTCTLVNFNVHVKARAIDQRLVNNDDDAVVRSERVRLLDKDLPQALNVSRIERTGVDGVRLQHRPTTVAVTIQELSSSGVVVTDVNSAVAQNALGLLVRDLLPEQLLLCRLLYMRTNPQSIHWLCQSIPCLSSPVWWSCQASAVAPGVREVQIKTAQHSLRPPSCLSGPVPLHSSHQTPPRLVCSGPFLHPS